MSALCLPEQMFAKTDTDAVVIGEGEKTVLELVRAMLNNGDLSRVKGIAYPSGNKINFTEPRGLIEDLDALPLPCHDAFNLDRGCPHKCIYCSGSKFWHRKWRPRSAENVWEEIEWLYKDFQVRNFMFFDDNFTVNRDRAINICQGIIRRNMKIRFVAESHVTHINPEILKWMKKSGCYRIDFGVESGSPRILKTINKKQTVEQIENAFKMAHEAGIYPRAYLMVGNPGEDESTIKETAALMKKIKPWDTMGAFPLLIFPNTRIYEMAKSKGIIDDEFWLKSDEMLFYTADHTTKELMALRELLMKQLAKNSNSFGDYIRYIMKKSYYRHPALQKLRKWRGLLGAKL
jgi:radical SAM superfamily enzyme YgiQ (UPF0313 family)